MIDNFLNINSIDPIYWGKSGWIFLNSIALTYNPNFKEQYKLFIEQLPIVLPCKSCGENLKNNMSTIDNALESKENFLLWLLKIRNDISSKYNKPVKTINQNINEIFSLHSNINNQSILMIILLFIVLFLLIILFKYTKS